MENIREKMREIEGKWKKRRINRVLGLITYFFDVGTLSIHLNKGKMQKTSSFMQHLRNM